MPDAAIADAPGRVNLIGEHTDYHQGFVLPTVIPQRTRAEVTRRPDGRVRAISGVLSDRGEEYELGREQRGRGWLDYVQGVTALLTGRGITLSGFDLRIESTVPVGAGVSSSAALEVSVCGRSPNFWSSSSMMSPWRRSHRQSRQSSSARRWGSWISSRRASDTMAKRC